MKLIYVENVRLPTEKAHGYQIMKTCEAMARAGVEIELVVADRKNPLGMNDAFEYYGIVKRFSIMRLPVIDFVSSVPAPLKSFAFALERWSFYREVRRRHREWSGNIFYTRDVGVAEALIDGEKPVFVELHDAPRSLPPVAGWVVISNGLRDLLNEKGIDPQKITVAHDAYDEEEFTHLPSREDARRAFGISENTFLAVYTGHLFPWKGMDGIASAFRRLPEHCTLAIVGGNQDDLARVKRIAGETPRVRWTGYLPRGESRKWLAAADAAVLPTSAKFEIGKTFTSPLKLFEYLAVGLPVIASDVPSSREILDESVAAFYRADDAEDFARVLASFGARSPDERRRVSNAAKEKAKSHTWTARGKAIAEFLKRNYA